MPGLIVPGLNHARLIGPGGAKNAGVSGRARIASMKKPGPSGDSAAAAGQPQRRRHDGQAKRRAGQKWISYSSCPRSVRRGAAEVKPKRIPAFHFSEPGPNRTTEPKSCGPMR